MKHFLKIILAVTLSFPLTAAQGAGAIKSLDWPPVHQNIGSALGVTIQDDFSQGMVNRLSIPLHGVQPFCTSLDDPACAKHTSIGWWILRILPLCIDTDENDDCVEGLTLTKDGDTRESKLLGRIKEKTWQADKKRGLPIAGSQGIWSNPFSPLDTDRFYVNVFGDLHTFDNANGPFKLTDFFASVTPFTTVRDNVPHSCLFPYPSGCPYRIPFEEGVQISLTLHLNPALTGWLAGRLESPQIRVTNLNASVNRITVTGAPVDVNLMQARIPYNSAPAQLLAFMNKVNDGCPISQCDVGIESSGEATPDYLEAWKAITKDVATASIPHWSISRSSITTYSPCIKNGFVGVVTTNATAYQQSMPILDGSDLVYKVAGLHFNPDGVTPASGTYDMLLRSDVARCIYNFSKAPIKATLSITSGTEVKDITTETLGESDGWLHLSAKNFHFSSNTIKIRLTQDGQSVITCQKGKSKKIIRAAKPKCPSGYKKVA